jgi:hypothetical protein
MTTTLFVVASYSPLPKPPRSPRRDVNAAGINARRALINLNPSSWLGSLAAAL